MSFAIFSFLIGFVADITNPYWVMLAAYVLAFISNIFYILAERYNVK